MAVCKNGNFSLSPKAFRGERKDLYESLRPAIPKRWSVLMK